SQCSIVSDLHDGRAEPLRGREMNHFSRRQGSAGAGAASMLGAPTVRSKTNQQTLRFIAEADLKALDPIWTTTYVTRNHGYLVCDTPERRETTERSVQAFPRGLAGCAAISKELSDDLEGHDERPN